MLAQLRQSRPVDTLSREHVDVVELRELLGGKGFRRAERHVTGVVDHDVERPFSAMIFAMPAFTDSSEATSSLTVLRSTARSLA